MTSQRRQRGTAIKAVDTPAGAVMPADPNPKAALRRPFLSAGVRNDLEVWGKATCPATGGVFTRDPASGKIAYTDRSGHVTDLP